MAARELVGELMGPDPRTTREDLTQLIGLTTTVDKTAIFICTYESCYRLLPDKAKLLVHRSKDHSVESPQENLWESVVTWPEIKKRELALESVMAAKKKAQQQQQEAVETSGVDIYAFDEDEKPAVDHVKASYLPLPDPAAPKPLKATTPPPVVPQKREIEELIELPPPKKGPVTEVTKAAEQMEVDYEPPEPTADADSPYDPPAPSPTVRTPSPLAVAEPSINLPLSRAQQLEPEVAKPVLPTASVSSAIEALPKTVKAQSPVRLSPPKLTASTFVEAPKPSTSYVPYQPPTMTSVPAALGSTITPKASMYERPANRGAIPGLGGSAFLPKSSLPPLHASLPPKPVTQSGPRRTPPPPLPVVMDRRFIPREEVAGAAERARPASETDIQSILAKLRAPSPVSGSSAQPNLAAPAPQSPNLSIRPSWLFEHG